MHAGRERLQQDCSRICSTLFKHAMISMQMVFKYWLQTTYNYQVGDTEAVHQVMALSKSLAAAELPKLSAFNACILFPSCA